MFEEENDSGESDPKGPVFYTFSWLLSLYLGLPFTLVYAYRYGLAPGEMDYETVYTDIVMTLPFSIIAAAGCAAIWGRWFLVKS